MSDDDLHVVKSKLAEWMKDSLTLPGDAQPSLDEIFPDDFIRENTDFEGLDEFLEAGPFDPEGESVVGPDVDYFVGQCTEFAHWQELQQKAEIRLMEEQF